MAFIDYFPIGGIMSFGGNHVDTNIWLPCDGRQLTKNKYPDLFTAIEYTYGGSGDNFKIPDYRGYFLRGVSQDSQNDPEASQRTIINPDYKKGESLQNRVGTSQEYATRKPSSPFISIINNLPNSNFFTHGETCGNIAYDGGDFKGATCTDGGDNETRPKNVYVNLFIKAR